MLNKAFITNLVAALIVGLGFLLTGPASSIVLNAGLFALSGGLTNWLAVHMLFEKIPGFYGSGVIPSRFEEFKHGIKQLIMQQFFTQENISQFIAESGKADDSEHDESFVKKMADKVDFNGAYDSLVDVIMSSSFGGMLSMLGGAEALNPLRDPFIEKMRDYLGRITEDQSFVTEFQQASGAKLLARVESIVDKRIEELTPQLVKEIIQQMIRKHLGWLVVWGGVIGGLIGLLVGVFF